MALLSKAEGGAGFDPVPEGTHVAINTMVVDMGIQESPWGNKEKVYHGFEVPGVRVKWTDQDGKEHEGPAFIGMTNTNSIHEKSRLGQLLVSWRGKAFTREEQQGFDLFTTLGVPCMISVTHRHSDGKTYANISSIMRLPAGMEAPKAESNLIGYTPGDTEKIGNLDKLPKWLKEKCEKGHGAAANHPVTFTTDVASGNKPETYSDDFNDDLSGIPF